MLKRLLVGWIKGLLFGGAVGAAIHFGLHWSAVDNLLGFLIAMGACATTGVLTGRAPWQAGAWIESLLKGIVGAGVGALLYWLGTKIGSFALPFDLGLPEGTPWFAAPIVFAPAIASLYGAVIELDNTGESRRRDRARDVDDI